MARVHKTKTQQLDRKWATLITVCIASFLEPLDTTVVVVALPTIQRSLDASFAELQWIVSAYTLTFAAFLMTGGTLGDRFGRRRIFITGLTLFAVMSLLCGLAPSPLVLNLARGAQGLGAALTFTITLALLVQEFHGRERAMAFGIWGALQGAGLSLGPLIGGLVTAGLGWRWIFLGNVPVCAFAIWLTLAKVRESRDPETGGLDWVGLVTFTTALFLLIFALVTGNEHGWGSLLIVGALVGVLVMLGAFLAVELRQRRPMFDLKLFRNGTFTGASLVAVIQSISFFTFFIYLPLYFQGVLGFSPVQAGLALLPLNAPLFVMGILSGKIVSRLPTRVLLSAGLAINGLGLLWMKGLGADSGWTALLGGSLVAGIGCGLSLGEVSNVAIGIVPDERSGMASGINNTMRQVGFALGVAGLGAILTQRISSRLFDLTWGTPAAVDEHNTNLVNMVAAGDFSRAAASFPPEAQRLFTQAAKESFISGIDFILLVAAVIAIVGAVLAFVLVRTRDIPKHQRPVTPTG
ncbi:MFS transporter [Scytonema sp. NUACC21]